MNPPDRRDVEPEPATRTAPQVKGAARSPLAVHGDPTLSAPNRAVATGVDGAARTTDPAGARVQRPQVAWIPPTNLPTMVGRELLGRAVEMQTAFARRNWRAPVRIGSAVRDRLDRPHAADPDDGRDRDRGQTAPAVDVADASNGALDGPEPEGLRLG
ncbi:hypothetical protein [Pengzhenrongella sicca]|uniref:Uncharacterized protein n=1 Tax=Pengzhenrongella sicca TaxID=2819238 RepID=A0A8A4ZCK7_9MICO|nr:hypothetical protein [Pengzhenrongella sicca]QTE28613.1 hypothetical protein J4E96_14785 [Pengzhenrongella sicca]